MSLRIGQGYDIHRLEKGHPFCLGGIQIPYGKGAVGHSDADVLLHALCDALLGALALGDIGQHFPDHEARYKDIDSKILLREVVKKVRQKGYVLVNCDSTVCLQKPRIAPYIPEMQKCLSEILELPPERISIKATTHEQLGSIGREEGVSAQAIVLLRTA